MIELDVDGRIATITLADPDRRNTISSLLNAELISAMDELEQRDDVGAVVVTGAGRAFCAGADLDDLAACRTRRPSGGSTPGSCAWPARRCPRSPRSTARRWGRG